MNNDAAALTLASFKRSHLVLTCPIECLWGRVFFKRQSILLLLLYYVHGKHLRSYRSVKVVICGKYKKLNKIIKI